MLLLNGVLRFFLPADYLLARKVNKLKLDRVAVYGAGELGMALVQRLQERGILLSDWYDGFVKGQPRKLLGHEVKSPQNLAADAPLYLVIASEAYANEIIQGCVASGYKGRFIRV